MKRFFVYFTIFMFCFLFAENNELKADNIKQIGNLQWSAKAHKTMNWNDAVNYCKNLNENGHSDWRLPNIDELRTLIQNHPGTQSGGSCQISEKAGKLARIDWTNDCIGRRYNSDLSKPTNDSDWVWSSSVLSYESDGAWNVNLDIGEVFFYDKNLASSALCVRNSSPADAAKSTDSKNKKEATKESTKEEKVEEIEEEKKVSRTKKSIKIGNLYWSEKSPKVMNWDKAKQYCENLTENNHKDWRLPTISELRTLIINCPSTQTGGECGVTNNCLASYCLNNTCSGCRADGSGKHSKLGDMIDIFWSSSVVSDRPNGAWFVSFGRKEVNAAPINMDDKIYVRCVR